MFSREWFFYVFGRWVVISGIAGAIVQYFFSDLLGIPTIPAFLLNQFCLACVFWYVDKLIFKRHFKKGLLDFFRFPRIKTAYGLTEQFDKVNQEFSGLRTKIAGNEEQPEKWLNEFVDFEHSVEMLERLLRERNIDVDREYEKVKIENLQKGILYRRGRKNGQEAARIGLSRRPARGGAAFRRRDGDLFADQGPRKRRLSRIPQPHQPRHGQEGARRVYPGRGADHRDQYLCGKPLSADQARDGQKGMGDKPGRRPDRPGGRRAGRVDTSKVFVAGAVGGLGEKISPYGKLSLVEAHAAFHEQIQALVDGGVDLIMLETMASFLEAKEAVLVCKETTDIPIVCQLTFTEQGTTVYGDKLAGAFEELGKLGADVVGLNCSIGPRKMIELLGSLPASFTGMIRYSQTPGRRGTRTAPAKARRARTTSNEAPSS